MTHNNSYDQHSKQSINNKHFPDLVEYCNLKCMDPPSDFLFMAGVCAQVEFLLKDRRNITANKISLCLKLTKTII